MGGTKESSVTSTSQYPAVVLRLSRWARGQNCGGNKKQTFGGGRGVSDCKELEVRLINIMLFNSWRMT